MKQKFANKLEESTISLIRQLGKLSSEELMQKHMTEEFRRDHPMSTWENIRPEIQRVIDGELTDKKTGKIIKQKGEFPTGRQLQAAGFSWLVGQIFAHHGGFNSVKEKLGFYVIQNSPGQYSSWDAIKPEIQKAIDSELRNKDTGELIKKKGGFPTQVILRDAGLSWLGHQIQSHHGGFIAVRRKFGLVPPKSETGHWSQWGDLKDALAIEISKEYVDDKGKIVKKAGEFPTQKKLAHFGAQGLTSAITKHHGGLWKVCLRMGYNSMIVRGRVRDKMNRFWKEWANVERELKAEIDAERTGKDGKLLKAAGEFPSNKVLRALGKHSLASSINMYHGGFLAVRKRLGFAINPESIPGYWDDKWDLLEFKLREEIAKEYKDERGNVVKAAGEFPKQMQLASFASHSLLTGIKQNGGLLNVRKKLGFRLPMSPRGEWRDWNKFLAEFKGEIGKEYVDKKGRIFKRKGEFPSALKLKDGGRGDLVHAIITYHSGFAKVREKLGFVIDKAKRGYWRDWDEAKCVIEAIIVEPIRKDGKMIKGPWEFPTATVLESAGLFSLLNSIKEEFGGFPRVRGLFGFDLLMKPDGYWREWKNLEKELKTEIAKVYRNDRGKIIKRRGEFPTQKQLGDAGLSSFNFAIGMHGGVPVVMQKMGFDVRKRPSGFYKEWDIFKPELQKVIDSELKDKETGKVIKKKGEFPTQRQLVRSGLQWMQNQAQRHHGGMLAVRARMGVADTGISEARAQIEDVLSRLEPRNKDE